MVGSDAATLDTPTSTGTRLGLTALETPASVSILPGDVVRERGAQTVADAKAQAVGVTNRSNPGNGGNGLAARGFSDTGSVMQLFDGELMLVGASTVPFPFDPWMVERIEVLGGPASVMYGNGAIGGVVNVVPRKPDLLSRESSVRLAAGSFNTWRAALDTAGPIGANTTYRLDFSGNRSDGWLNDAPSDTTAFSASVRHRFRSNLSLTVSEDFGYQRPAEYFGSPTINGVVDPSHRDVMYNTADSEISYRDNWTQAKIEWQPSPNVTRQEQPAPAGRRSTLARCRVLHLQSGHPPDRSQLLPRGLWPATPIRRPDRRSSCRVARLDGATRCPPDSTTTS